MKELQAIYVIEGENGHLKIGISTSPWVRLAALQSATPTRLRLAFAADVCGSAAKLERAVHLRIGRMRVSGEWFLLNTEDAISEVGMAAVGLGFDLEQRNIEVGLDRRERKVEKSLPVSARLSLSTKLELEAYAAALDRSLSWVMEQALIEFMRKPKDA